MKLKITGRWQHGYAEIHQWMYISSYNNKRRVYITPTNVNDRVHRSNCRSSITLSWQPTTTCHSSSSSSVGRVPRRATTLPTRPVAVVNRLIGLLPSVINVDFIPNACSIFTCQSTAIQNCYTMSPAAMLHIITKMTRGIMHIRNASNPVK